MKGQFKELDRVRSKKTRWTGTVQRIIPWPGPEDDTVEVWWDRECFPPVGAICPEDPAELEKICPTK